MPRNDRFLVGIVVGVILLVVAAFAVTLNRPPPTYRDDDAPEAAVHNYLLALQQKDHERAWGLLSPDLPGYPPTVEAFADDVSDNYGMMDFDNHEVAVESADVTGDLAVVTVRDTYFYRGGLFDSGQNSHTFTMKARRGEAGWRLTHGDQYWNYCWDEPGESCRRGVPKPAEIERP